MNQCLRCSRPCSPASLFCDTCQSQLHTQLWQESRSLAETPTQTPPAVAVSSAPEEKAGTIVERETSPIPTLKTPTIEKPQATPLTPPVPMPAVYHGNNLIDQVVQRMSQAAERIALAGQHSRRILRPSRLKPISKKIPIVGRLLSPSENTPADKAEQATLPTWPWPPDLESSDHEHEIWVNRTDPLLARQIPRGAQAGAFEDDDALQRAVSEGLATRPLPIRRARKPHTVQAVFAVLVALAFAVAGIDGILASVALFNHHHAPTVQGGPSFLTLSPNVASVGQTVTLHIAHFLPNTHIFITHDVEEPVQLTNGAALVGLDGNGAANVAIVIDDSWGPGFHTVQAEDVVNRYTASATLQIIGAGPTRPSHLLIGATSLNFGADVEGANTIQSLVLHNSGGGAISWAASSNQPWLLLAPAQGIFSSSQTIAVGVQRANLKPGDYNGTITFSSNVGENEWVQVHMSVRPLPANAGSVLVTTPVLLSFTALDGGVNPAAQTLTISNPGSQPLSWSLAGNNPVLLNSQSILLHSINMGNNWLSTDQTSGTIAPHSSGTIQVMVNSSDLLAGVYSAMLVFNGGQNTFDTPQNVGVALTVQPHCGLQLNTGSMSFTAVAGQGNPANQSLTLGATESCSGALTWKAASSASWLSVSPASGQVRGAQKAMTAVSINASILKPGTYNGNITFVEAGSTQTVMVQLVVQAAPPPSQPILGAAPLNLNFSTTQGMPNPPGQVVTITNNGGSTLYWHTTVNQLASSWLGASPSGDSIPARSAGQVTVNIDTSNLTPNTYVGEVVLNGANASGATASGSPQTIMVNLVVLPPCTLQQPSSSSLAFSAVQGTSNPSPQTVNITASGNCDWPIAWNVAISGGASWLSVSPMSGTFPASGQSATLTVNASISGLSPNTYNAQVTITASGNAQGSPQSFSVSLTVLPPCSLSVQAPPGGFSFSAVQGQPAPPAQNFSFGESGTCAWPVSWSAIPSSGSGNWLATSPSSGSDSGNGVTVSVSVNPQGLAPGTYTGTITVSATGSGGAPVQSSPQSINVSFTVSGFTISGGVIACADQQCSSSQPLPGAALTLVNTSTNQTFNATADGSGNYSFTNVPLGSYTLTVTGSIGSQSYSGNVSFSVTGNMSGFNVNTYPPS
jgi:hypothetical protein